VDYYAVLGVPANASVDEIERSYRTLARKVHPDRNGADAERATARMKQLNEIREILTDPLLRAGYDDRLRLERLNPRVTYQPPSQGGAARPTPRRATPPSPSYDRPPQAPPPRPAPPPPSRFAGGYTPHPHVAPFLRTQAEITSVEARRPRRDLSPIFILLSVAAVLGAVALLWPQPEPVAARPPLPVEKPKAPRPAVVVVRGDLHDLRRAVRKTAQVVPVGASFDEVIQKFGPPDRSEPGLDASDLSLIYGQSRVHIHDGLVVGGSP
jgi:hypothetical protein